MDKPTDTHNAAPAAPARPSAEPRSAYKVFTTIATRWGDNDAYGHVNNVIYYALFDTAVNRYLIEAGALDIHQGEVIGLVVETHCNYFAPIEFPQMIDIGMRVAHRGASSVRYEIGVFAADATHSAASGHFVHVYVDRVTRRPHALPVALRAALEGLA
ncbi:MAG: thioesterase [Rhizobacter sp.]|nr:thioesterase [Rhizobacter sp.]